MGKSESEKIYNSKSVRMMGFTWLSSDYDSMLLLLGARVQFLVREVDPMSQKKKEKKD